MKKQTIFSGRPWRRSALRIAAALLAVTAALWMPVDWQLVGQAVSLCAAGLRRPENAAVLLEHRLAAAEREEALSSVSPVTPSPEGEASVPEEVEDGESLLALAPVLSISPPGDDGTGGKIVTEKLSTGKSKSGGVAVSNKSGRSVDITAALGRPLTQTWQDTDAPQVLILHTHTTEQYMLYDAGYYNEGDRDRTTDQRQNVCAVGRAVAAALEEAGVGVIHDTTRHDDPYTGAYSRSAKTAQEYLQEYPSIRVVLDLHRDAIVRSDTVISKPTVEVAGKKAAQVMFIVGVADTAALPHPRWEENLTLAARWQQAMNESCPRVMRPLYAVASRYNQHLSPGYLLVEVGSEGNTVEEAVYSGQLLGKTLAELLA